MQHYLLISLYHHRLKLVDGIEATEGTYILLVMLSVITDYRHGEVLPIWMRKIMLGS